MQHTEAQQDAEGADMGHQQIEEAGAPDLRQSMLGGHQEIRTQRHGFPGHHEQVGIVGQDDHYHAGQKHVVLKTQQTRRGAFALAEITGGEDRDAGARAAQQHQKEAGQRVQPHVERQIRQPERKHGALRGEVWRERQRAHAGDAERHQRAERKKGACDPADAIGLDQTERAHQ